MVTNLIEQSYYYELSGYNIKSWLEGFHLKYLRQVIKKKKKRAERQNLIKK